MIDKKVTVNVWYLIAPIVVILLLVIFWISAWRQTTLQTIDALKSDIKESEKIYKQRERAIDSIISLQENEHKRALEAEERAEKAEKGLVVALSRIKQIDVKEKNEKNRIAALDSGEQFKLLRANINRRGR